MFSRVAVESDSIGESPATGDEQHYDEGDIRCVVLHGSSVSLVFRLVKAVEEVDDVEDGQDQSELQEERLPCIGILEDAYGEDDGGGGNCPAEGQEVEAAGIEMARLLHRICPLQKGQQLEAEQQEGYASVMVQWVHGSLLSEALRFFDDAWCYHA